MSTAGNLSVLVIVLCHPGEEFPGGQAQAAFLVQFEVFANGHRPLICAAGLVIRQILPAPTATRQGLRRWTAPRGHAAGRTALPSVAWRTPPPAPRPRRTAAAAPQTTPVLSRRRGGTSRACRCPVTAPRPSHPAGRG